MRASLWVLGFVVVAARVAEASTVVVLSDPGTAPALGSALQVTLAGRGVAIATLPAPDGNLRLDRAAAAQHAAVQFNADAALWIDSQPDGTEVCAVSADGRFFRHAPLPVGEGDTARMFAAIGTSLLDELLAPPDAPAVDVDVHVHVGPDGAVSATPAVAMAPAAMAPPGMAIVAPPAMVESRVRRDRTLLELGPMASPITFGAELGVMTPIGDAYRLGGFGFVNVVPTDNNHILGGGGVELRHVGRGLHHFDIGPVAGVAGLLDASPDGVVFVGARLAYVWEGEHHGSSISLVPVLAMTSQAAVPGIYASYRWELPL